MGELTFDALPFAVGELIRKIDRIEQFMLNKNVEQVKNDRILNIEEAASYLKLSVPTIYGLVSRSEIPNSKKGKRLYFLEDDLFNWVRQGRRKTQTELAADAKTYIAHKSKKRG
jgi:excisionase family DNA binding protein